MSFEARLGRRTFIEKAAKLAAVGTAAVVLPGCSAPHVEIPGWVPKLGGKDIGPKPGPDRLGVRLGSVRVNFTDALPHIRSTTDLTDDSMYKLGQVTHKDDKTTTIDTRRATVVTIDNPVIYAGSNPKTGEATGGEWIRIDKLIKHDEHTYEMRDKGPKETDDVTYSAGFVSLSDDTRPFMTITGELPFASFDDKGKVFDANHKLINPEAINKVSFDPQAKSPAK